MLPTESIRRVLDAALTNGGDLAEIYLENTERLSLTLDEGRLEEATQGNDIGGGVRVFYGNNAAYAYTDDLSQESLTEAATAAAAAARGANGTRVTADLTKSTSRVDSRIERPFEQMSTREKAEVLRQMDAITRRHSPHIVSVQCGYTETRRRVWIYNSDGVWAEDDRSFLEFRGQVTAQKGDVRQSSGDGDRRPGRAGVLRRARSGADDAGSG